MSIANISQLEQVLVAMLNPTTVKEATDMLNKNLNSVNTIVLLIEFVQMSNSPELKQMAFVLLRKKLMGKWGKLQPAVQEKTKALLLDILVREQSAPVRRAAAELVSTIGRIIIPLNQWNALFEFLINASNSPQAHHREISMSVFESLVADIGPTISSQFPLLINLFKKGLTDPDANVRLATLKAISSIVQHLDIDKDFASFRELIAPMIVVIRHCLSTGAEEEAVNAFEIFDELIETPNPIVATIIPELIKFSLEVGAAKNLELNTRQQALNIVEWAATFKPKTLSKHDLVRPILQVVFPMCAETEEDDDDPEIITAHRYASGLLDILATNLPAKHFMPAAMEYISIYIVSPEASLRRAAMMALAVMAEGCAYELKNPVEKMNQLLEFVFKAIQDLDQGVREAACITLGQFATHLQPEISQHTQTVLHMLFNALGDADDKVRLSACYAVEAFCQNIDADIAPYLEPLMTKLVVLLQQGNIEMKEIAMSAISSTASAAKKNFLPFYPTLVTILREFAIQNNPETSILKCRAMECIGNIALAVGKDEFRPVLREFMRIALEGCALEDFYEIKQFCYIFFGNVAETFKGEFAEFLPEVVPLLLASCQSEDGIEEVRDNKNEIAGIEEDSDDEEDDDFGLTVRTSFLDEKAAAVDTLGIFAEHTTSHFVPYLETVIKSFQLLLGYFHTAVRQCVLMSLQRMVMGLNATYPVPPAQQGEISVPQIHPSTKQLLDMVLPQIAHRIEIDEDKETCGVGFECIEKLIKELGSTAIVPHVNIIIKSVHLILTKKAACQRHEEEDEDEDQDLDMMLIECAFDCLVVLAKTFGAQFDTYLEALSPTIVKYYQQKSHGDNYRSLAIGTLADLIKALGPLSQKHLERYFPVALKAMQDSSPETRSNATFMMGVLLLGGGALSAQLYGNVFPILANLFNDTTLPNIVDNVCGAVSRMIVANPTAVPLDQVLPVLFKQLPLRVDMEENATVYGCISLLFKNGLITPQSPHLPLAIGAFARALSDARVQVNLKEEMASVLDALMQSQQSLMEQVVQTLPPTEVQVLQNVHKRNFEAFLVSNPDSPAQSPAKKH